MEPWKIQAILAALFAGLTSILAKSGMKTLGPDVSLALRTSVVFVLVAANAFIWTSGRPVAAMAAARPRDLMLLALSGLTTSLSWIFYYRAMKTGTVSFVALVDKGSIIVTLLLSFFLLHEPFTPKTACGAGLILLGIGVLTWK
ncbi:MAG TPA: EamA family transporter [Chthoniobacter sp.]|nr:EamA family transporter [Chthoniobacter sp.]